MWAAWIIYEKNYCRQIAVYPKVDGWEAYNKAVLVHNGGKVLSKTSIYEVKAQNQIRLKDKKAARWGLL